MKTMHVCVSCPLYLRPLHALGRWLVRHGWLSGLLYCLLLVVSLHATTWTRDKFSGPMTRYVAALPCGQGVVTQAAQVQHGWYWRVGAKHGGAMSQAWAEADAAEVCK